MLKSIKFRPVVSGILACILFGLLLQGCSTKGSFRGFLKFWRSGDAEYAAQREFGGWGVRTGPSGKAYTAFGTQGVQLWFKDEKRILIGSQRAGELAAALRAAGVNVR